MPLLPVYVEKLDQAIRRIDDLTGRRRERWLAVACGGSLVGLALALVIHWLTN
jgi:hypothetical protein